MRTPNIGANYWLPLGRRLHALQTVGARARWEAEKTQSGHSSQTLNRLARAAAFLEANFPVDLAAGRITAGASLVLEFMMLFELDEPLARSRAQEMLADKVSVRELRALRRGLLQKSMGSNGRAPHHTQRYGRFSEAAVAVLTENPFSLASGESVALSRSPVRDTLAPKLHGITASGQRIAVDIKAPDPMAARTEAATSAALASRISILLLRFHQVVVVVPPTAEDYARGALALLAHWAMDSESILQRSSFRVLDPATGQSTRVAA